MGKKAEKHASKGFVLPLVLIFMAVFSVFSITFTQVLINTNRNIREQVDFTKAYYIARSGADIGRQLVASGETSWATFTGSLDSGAFHVSLEENNLIVSDATLTELLPKRGSVLFPAREHPVSRCMLPRNLP